MSRSFARRSVVAVLLLLSVVYAAGAGLTLSPFLDVPSVLAQSEGRVPGNALGGASDAEMWRTVRQGISGTVSIPDPKAATLVQSEGDNWRAWRNGPIAVVGAIMFWLMFFVVLGFYGIRGKVRISHGRSGRKVERFKPIERFAHWLVGGSFIILAITGVNLLYGRYVVRFFHNLFAGDSATGLQGNETYAMLTEIGKYVHNYVGFAFIVGLLLIFVLWVKDNIWDKYDWGWIKKGGGLLIPTEHPRAAKFNFGQKTVFWMVMGGGAILAFTGLNLLFPYVLFDVQQMQWIQAIHATLSQIMCMLMIAHIYIGSIGMEDAFHAMSTGYVDENWAKEHHSAWFEKVQEEEAAIRQKAPKGAPGAPAE